METLLHTDFPFPFDILILQCSTTRQARTYPNPDRFSHLVAAWLPLITGAAGEGIVVAKKYYAREAAVRTCANHA